MSATRSLLVVADDFGIGMPTSQAILELAQQGLVTGSVLLVNSPYAEQSVKQWKQAGQPMQLGWHPNLTLDQPVLPAERVPSLVNREGRFWSLGQFILRTLTRRIRRDDIEAEMDAQYERFIHLVGTPPSLVNSHQHVQIFPPVGDVLAVLLAEQDTRPYFRRVSEPFSMIAQIPGARIKRSFLTLCGTFQAVVLDQHEFPGNDWLAGITDPPHVENPEYFARWLTSIPGEVVELACHPGYYDESLIGRECVVDDPLLMRRVNELKLMRKAGFRLALARAGFALTSPAEFVRTVPESAQHAA